MRKLWAIGAVHGNQHLADLKALPIDELTEFCDDVMDLVKAEGRAPAPPPARD